MNARSLDHVAIWVADRDRLASFLCERLGMHVIERTDAFTLVGVDARLGKMTLFAADGPREQGSLARVALRVRDLAAAESQLPGARREGGAVLVDAPEGLRLALVEAPDAVDYDLEHVVLRVADPDASAGALAELGFQRRDGRLAVADRWLRLEPGGRPEGERPLLNHLALLVDSADEIRSEAEREGIEI